MELLCFWRSGPAIWVFLLDQQMEAVAGRAFAQLGLVINCSPAWSERIWIQCLILSSPAHLDHWNTLCKDHLKALVGAKCKGQDAHISWLLNRFYTCFQALHGLPINFWVQFKMLLLIYKDLCGLAPGYLQDHISALMSAQQRCSCQEKHWFPPFSRKGWSLETLLFADRTGLLEWPPIED